SVRVDARALTEVIYTLVDNAAKYAPANTRIRIAARRAADETVQVSIEDEGRGIPVALPERVFDKFFRATQDASSVTVNPTGTGMGLAIARGIVEAHGGRIWIEAGSDGRGARVVFIVPVGDEEVSEPQRVDDGP